MTATVPASASLSPPRSKPALSDDELDDPVGPLAGFQIGEYKGPFAAHAPCVAVHHLKARSDQWRQVDLVDDQEVGAGDAGAAFARDLVAGGDVDDIDRQIGQFGREGRRQIVAAR